MSADLRSDDPNRVVTVTAHEGKTGQEMAITYTNYKVVGNGSFGVVFAAKMLRELFAAGRRRRRCRVPPRLRRTAKRGAHDACRAPS